MGFKLKHIALALVIIVLLNLFVYAGIRTFYKGPDRTKYCGDLRYPVLNEPECIAAGGQWYPNVVEPGSPKAVPDGYCGEKATCYTTYEEAMKPYNRNIFIIYVILSFIALVIGFLLKVDSVAAGLNFGAVILLLTGTIRYWRDMNDYLRFVIIGAALAVAIWIGYKKLK